MPLFTLLAKQKEVKLTVALLPPQKIPPSPPEMESHSLKIKSFELNLLVILWNLPGPHAWEGGERKGVKGVWYGYPASFYLLKSTLEKPELLKVNSGIFLVSLLDIFLKLFWSFLFWLCTRKWRLVLKGLWETFLLSLQHCKNALKNSPCFACSR